MSFDSRNGVEKITFNVDPTGANITASTALLPDAEGGADIGSTSAEWGDAYIADDKKIQFGSGQDATIEYDEDGTDQLRFAGAAAIFEQDMTLVGGEGALKLTDGTKNSIEIPNNKANALIIEEADNAYMSFDSRNGAELVTLNHDATLAGGDGALQFTTAGENSILSLIHI